jgi:medium-chain acyl-[acyl-carrier-protein] hydrolase
MNPLQHLHLKETHPIRTYEVDYTNHLKVSSLFNYMQEAASRSADRLGFGYDELIKEGLFWVLSRVKLVLKDTPGLGDTLTVETWPKGVEGLFATRDFRMLDGRGREICLATTSWALLSGHTMRPLPAQELQERLTTRDPEAAIAELPGKIPEPARKEVVYDRHIRYLDLDANRHVNNVKYIEYLLDSFPMDHYQTRRLASVQVNFLREAKFGDTIRIFRGVQEEGPVYLEGENQHEKKVFQALVEWR